MAGVAALSAVIVSFMSSHHVDVSPAENPAAKESARQQVVHIRDADASSRRTVVVVGAGSWT